MTLHNGSSLRSPLHNGIFSQLVKAPQIICAMRIVDPNGGTLYVDTVNSDPLCDLPIAN